MVIKKIPKNNLNSPVVFCSSSDPCPKFHCDPCVEYEIVESLENLCSSLSSNCFVRSKEQKKYLINWLDLIIFDLCNRNYSNQSTIFSFYLN